MKKTNKRKGDAPNASQKKPGKRGRVTKLPKMEMYTVLGLELSKTILEKVAEVEKSVEILARQKKRELDLEEAESGTDQ